MSRSGQVVDAKDYPILRDALPDIEIRQGHYRVDFARQPEDLDEILRMRFEVFNVEMGEGLDESYLTGRDQDAYDLNCHHLRVIDELSGSVVGTYRLQTSAMAARFRGFYSSDEFDLSSLPTEVIENSVEVGRACVAREHRHGQVLFVLWRGLAAYMQRNRKRFLFGCCSLTSQDPDDGRRVMAYLSEHGYTHDQVRVRPWPSHACYDDDVPPHAPGRIEIPPLFRIYLRYGGKACGPPAIDRLFKTIDFFVLFDVAAMDRAAYETFFSEGSGPR